MTVSASTLVQTFTSENKGLSTNISQRQLQAAPQGNRSIDDVMRLNPRVSVTDQGTGAISAAGMNNRYNNIAVDGVRARPPSPCGRPMPLIVSIRAPVRARPSECKLLCPFVPARF